MDLNKLILASNQITEISSEIQLLLGLTVLDLHDNQLSYLPDEIGKLENLTKLNLNHNQLIELPMLFFDLRNLKTLTACHNRFENIRYIYKTVSFFVWSERHVHDYSNKKIKTTVILARILAALI